MNQQINLLKNVWEEGQRKAVKHTALPKIAFEEIIGSILSVGPFYFYIVDFFDMSLSNVSPSIKDIHGFDPHTVTFDDILKTIHPDDMKFVADAEAATIDFLYNTIGKEHLLDYKANYSFRSKMKNGKYELLNHQAIVLTVDDSGRFGKALNIHTNIEHIASKNSNTFSLLSLSAKPSYTNIEVAPNGNNYIAFTRREIEIIRCIAVGKSSKEIAESLFISEGTVKKHRTNINQKSGCKNAVELVNKSLVQGLI